MIDDTLTKPTPRPPLHTAAGFRNAYYIKLGAGGAWEADCLANGRLRIGWFGQTLADIDAGRWDVIEAQLRKGVSDRQRGAITRDLNSLRAVADSTSADVWITFSQGRLWWGRVVDEPMNEDAVSKFRVMDGGWSDRNLQGGLLLASQLPGKLHQVSAFRATQCSVTDPDLLWRVICGVRSPISMDLQAQREVTSRYARLAIEALHWRDYEILVDLVFRASGWRREGVLGEQEKGYDLILREAITGNRYAVQVKSRARRAEVQSAAAECPPDVYRRLFFVVHSPAPDLCRSCATLPDHVELVDPQRLAELVVEAGLTSWLEAKAA